MSLDQIGGDLPANAVTPSDRCTSLRSRHAGVTQIEVLVGMVLTAVLVIGLVGLWTLVDEQFLRLQWRQQAVFQLNAQTERIAALYRYTDFASQDNADSHADDKIIEGRWIYRGDPDASITNLVVTETRNQNVTKAAFDQDQILYMDYPGPPNASSQRNVIWLDRSRDVTAELSWKLSKNGLDNCWNDSCYHLEVSLAFPYRFASGSDPLEIGFGDIETMTLKTLVGQRASSY